MLESDKTLLETAFYLIKGMIEKANKLNVARKDMLKLSGDLKKCEFTGSSFHIFGHTYTLDLDEALEFVTEQVAKLSRDLEMDRLQLARILRDITKEPNEV